MRSFDSLPEQTEAKRLLSAALAQGADSAAPHQGRAGLARASGGSGPAHAYLFHGPAGVGKRRAAIAFAAELLGGDPRVQRRSHPDLYVLEPLGDQIRIDAVRELRRDLHMRPFEAQRRVYLVFGAHLLNEEAADALLKDLEEPPDYAVIVLVADELGPLPETIRSRCQGVPFQRLSEHAVREEVRARATGLAEEEATAIARVAGGRLDRAERLLDPAAAGRRAELLETARSVYADPDFEPADAAARLLAAARARAAEAKEQEEAALEGLDLTAREAEQRVRRAGRGAEREELLASLEELASWYRDVMAAAAGAEDALVHVDRAEELREDGVLERLEGAERAAELVRETWRSFEEFQLSPGLALEALFIQLRRAFSSGVVAARG
jgi:DNA polymerase III subunit delta'